MGEYAHQSRPAGALRPSSSAGRTGMDVLYPRCAGLDVHKKTVLACVLVTPERGAPHKMVRTFGTLADEVLALGDWLAEQGVTHVALESTGVYWQPRVRHEALFDREGMKGP